MEQHLSIEGQNSKKILLIDSGTYFSQQTARDTAKDSDYQVLDIYDLPDYNLSGHQAVVIDEFADQELLFRQREQIWNYLNQGGLLIFSGHLYLPWIPGASLFMPKVIRNHADYDVMIPVDRHPIFEGVQAKDLTYNRGVAGFFARGHHPLPPHAEVLLMLSGGEPITYIDRHSTNGTILVHSGKNLLRYTSGHNTSGRIGMQLRQWMESECEQLAQKGITTCEK